METTSRDPELIKVEFEMRYDTSQGWDDEDNVNPYISMADPERDIEGQRSPDQIVIPMKSIRVLYDYPLDESVIFEFKADTPRGFTRVHLARQIALGYQRIYREEEEAVGDPGTVTNKCFNRACSSGPYGIWGHYIGDLMLCGVRQVKVNDNLFEIDVDS